MIQSFGNKETEKLFHRERSKHIPTNIQRITYRKLLILNAAIDINDLRTPPGNRLERLKGKRKNEYSIRINEQWRICFIWKDGNANEVQIEDYH